MQNIPFDYGSILIGEEIIFRALSQQQKFAATGQYGMTWDQQDEIAKSQAFFQANILRTDFTIPLKYQNCDPEPPCPWSKTEDKLAASDFWPVLTANDGTSTYAFRVAQRNDIGNQFNIGPTVIAYSPDQGELDPAIQAEFSYHKRDTGTGYTGPAIIEVLRQHRGTVQDTFYYLFDIV